LCLNVEDEAFDHSSFAKNRERLLEHEVSRAFFAAVLEQAHRLRLLSREHFTVDGTLLESWASFKSPHDGGGGRVVPPVTRRPIAPSRKPGGRRAGRVE
jgi:hypothetical protein